MKNYIKDRIQSGLYQRIRQDSPNTWAVIARVKGGPTVTHTIGPINHISAHKARAEAKRVLSQLASGIRPLDERRRDERIRHARQFTLAQAIEEYSNDADWKAKTRQDALSTLQRRFADWYLKPIASISKKDVLRRFKQIKKDVIRVKTTRDKLREDNGMKVKTFVNQIGLGETQRAFRYLNAVFNSFTDDDVENTKLLPHGNPCSVLNKKHVKRTLKPRHRYLDDEQRAQLYDALAISSDPEYPGKIKSDDADLIWFLIHTGLRLDEALSMRWGQVNFEKELFTALDTKNRRNHTLPMTDATLDMFKRRFEQDKKKKFVFPSEINPRAPMTASRVFARVSNEVGFDFTAHDLRRTIATVAFDLGYDINAIGQVLNHSKNNVTASYIQSNHKRLKEMLTSIQDALFAQAYN